MVGRLCVLSDTLLCHFHVEGYAPNWAGVWGLVNWQHIAKIIVNGTGFDERFRTINIADWDAA